MRVLIINSVCGTGSTGRICVDLYKELVAAGHECCIAYGRGRSSENIYTYKIGNNKDVYQHVLETRLFDNHGFASRKATKEFINFLDDYNPDVISLHNLHGYYLNVKELFSYLSKLNIKVFWTFHDCWPFSPHSAYIDRLSNGMLPEKNTTFYERYEYPACFLFSRSSYNYKRKRKYFTTLKSLNIITPSYWLGGLIKDSFFYDNEISVINNGIDLNNFFKDQSDYLKKKLNLKEKKIVLGVANIWEPRKGIQVFNEISTLLPDSYKIVLVGRVPKGTKINSKITILKQVSDIKELRQIYSSADIFLNPTLEDNYPTTNLEACACGTPVITSHFGGAPETIQKGKGIVFYNVKDLISKISNLEWFEKDSDIISYRIDKKIMFKKYIEYFERN